MYYIFGKQGCKKCVEVKEDFEYYGEDYKYFDISILNLPLRRKIVKIIREKQDGHLPLVLGQEEFEQLQGGII